VEPERVRAARAEGVSVYSVTAGEMQAGLLVQRRAVCDAWQSARFRAGGRLTPFITAEKS